MTGKSHSVLHLTIAITTTALLCGTVSMSFADDVIWQNVELLPDDLTSTGDAWTAVRCEDFGNQSHRIAGDDFELTQRTKITSIVYYAVGFGPSILDGHDWYIYEYGADDLPGKLIAFASDVVPNREDTGWVNTVFNTPIFRNTMNPTDLELDPGRYFIAFRSAACLTDGKYSILTTRWAAGSARALWNFGVLADGTVTERWMSMEEFNGVADQEWAFVLEGVPVSAGLTLAEPTPGRVGVLNQFEVSNATPGKQIYFAAALQRGETKIPGCPGVVIDLAQPEVIGRVRADADGVAVLTRFIPKGAKGRLLHFQAVEPNTCAVSPPLAFTFK